MCKGHVNVLQKKKKVHNNYRFDIEKVTWKCIGSQELNGVNPHSKMQQNLCKKTKVKDVAEI